MNTFIQKTKASIDTILQHQLRDFAINGRQVKKMHLQILWEKEKDQAEVDKTWEPMTQVYRDQPDLVREYFARKGLDCTSELQDDNRRCGRTQSNTSRGTPSKQTGFSASAERPRSMDMTPAERAKQKRMKRFQEQDRKLAEQQKAQNLSVSQMMFDRPGQPDNYQCGTPAILKNQKLGFCLPFGHSEEPRGSTDVPQESQSVWKDPFDKTEDQPMQTQADEQVDMQDASLWASKKREPVHAPTQQFNSVVDFQKHQKKQKLPEVVRPPTPKKQDPFADYIKAQFGQLETKIGIDFASSDFVAEQKAVKEKSLRCVKGTLLEHTPREVVAVAVQGSALLYLCAWHQINMDSFYIEPSWV